MVLGPHGVDTDWYRRRVDPDATTGEVLGHCSVALGGLLTLASVGFFAIAALRDAPPLREAGIVLVGLGVPLILAGSAFRLPLRRLATYAGAVATAATAGALLRFVLRYPDGWTFPGVGLPIVLTYLAGVTTLVVVGTVLPLLTGADHGEGARVELVEFDPDHWTWELHDSTGDLVATSLHAYDNEGEARAAAREVCRAAKQDPEVVVDRVD